MEKLPKELLIETAIRLPPPDFIKFCSINKKFNKETCESKYFWMRKLIKDYPKEMEEVQKQKIIISNPKDIYIKRFTSNIYKIEQFISTFTDTLFGESFRPFLNDTYKQGLTGALYEAYNKIVNYDFTKDPNPPQDIKYDVIIDEISPYYPEYPETRTPERESSIIKSVQLIDELLAETIFDYLKLN